MFMCRWMNGDVSFVSARTKEDAIVMLDEWDDAEGAEISQIRDFMVDFRLNDDGELGAYRVRRKLPRFHSGESVSSSAQSNDQRTNDASRGITAEGTEMVRRAVQEERTRPLKPSRSHEPATEAARELQIKMGASAAYAIALLNRWPPIFSTRLLSPAVSSSHPP
jgi:hypothetical protein